MQASSKFAKAIHICIYLNVNTDHTVSSSELAESLMTHAVVVRQLVALLKNYGILQTTPGSAGGVSLSKNPSEINLWDLYLATREGSLFKRPAKVNPECVVGSNLGMLLHDTFSTAELQMKNVLEAKTILQLTDELHRAVGGAALKKGH